MIPPYYKNSSISFATKHKKEDVVYPKFRELLGVTLIVPCVDTDKLGTFSGEIERTGHALEVAEKKAILGMKATGFSFGLASEGSFCPHPYIPFIASNQEILLFIDKERDFKLHESMVSQKTNFCQKIISALDEAAPFLTTALFPSHGLIVRPNLWEDKSVIFKGIRTQEDLTKAFTECSLISADSKVWLETDMRANLNPSRMSVIGELAERLAKRLGCACPSCNSPGWGCTGMEKGLPCEYCGEPTELLAKSVFGCVKCEHKVIVPREDGVTKAEQQYCNFCNP